MSDDAEKEYQTMILPLDADYPKKIEELAAQGWVITTGTAPYAVFNLCRQSGAIKAQIAIDEAGVTILKGGNESDPA